MVQGGLVKAGLDVAQIWLDGNETLVNTVDRDGNLLPISMVGGHAITHSPLVVLVSIRPFICCVPPLEILINLFWLHCVCEILLDLGRLSRDLTSKFSTHYR